MKGQHNSTLAGFWLIVFAAPTLTAYADAPTEHAYYLHALTDLRTARWLIEHQPGDVAVSAQEHAAAAGIDAALADIRRASIEDGKDTDDHVPVDAPNELPGHLQQALKLLRHAHDDIEREKEDAATHGLRSRAIRHVNAAIRATERAISNR